MPAAASHKDNDKVCAAASIFLKEKKTTGLDESFSVCLDGGLEGVGPRIGSVWFRVQVGWVLSYGEYTC
jgi:hypothetical protein